MKKPIVINVKNMYGTYFVNIIDVEPTEMVLSELYTTKDEAVKAFPALVLKKYRKTVKVWLVEAL